MTKLRVVLVLFFFVSCSDNSAINSRSDILEQGSFELNFVAKNNGSSEINEEFPLPKKENVFEFDKFIVLHQKQSTETNSPYVFWTGIRPIFDNQGFAKPELTNPNLAPADENEYQSWAVLVQLRDLTDIPKDSTVTTTYFYRTLDLQNYGRLTSSLSYHFFTSGDSIGVNLDVTLSYQVLTDGSRTFPDNSMKQ